MRVKDLVFFIFALFFNIGARLGVKKNRVGLVSWHNAHFADGLGEVERELKNRTAENGKDFQMLKFERTALESPLSVLRFVTVDAFRLGRAKYIFLNDTFMPLCFARPGRQTKVVQLWHGMGAFKKFGFDIEVPEEIRHREKAQAEKLDFVVCSSEGVRDIYARAFGLPEERVLASGSPAEDYYFRKTEKQKAKERLLEYYPELKDKYIVLYAPTFRDDREKDEELPAHFNAERICRAVNADTGHERAKDIEILVRLHPQVHGAATVKNAFDVTDYDNVNELCAAADMLVTDYSSICMDFVLMGKPVVFYAFDLDSYKGLRDFYFDYEDYVPGPVAKNEDELICAIRDAGNKKSPKTDDFFKFNFDEPDGRATARLLDLLFDG